MYDSQVMQMSSCPTFITLNGLSKTRSTVLFIGFYNKAEFVVDINSFNEHWMNSLWSAMNLTVHQFKNLSSWKGEKEISLYITLP